MAELLAGSAPLFIGVCTVLGLLVGSFLNVVILRTPVMLERRWRRECLNSTASPCRKSPRST